jgi:signal transduction histidine kinase
MRGNVDLLRQMIADLGGGTSQETAILDDVSLEAERMSRLVADLLLLAQADAGQHLRLRTIDVSQVAGDAARTARLLRDDVLVEATGLPGDLWVQGHADRLRQVMMILLDNAVKHSPPGGRVTLAAKRVERDGRASVAIRVSDEGLGIPTAEQPRIFERFYRAPGARSGEGTGLGLAIGRWIVEEHQGSIELASEPGQGATFTVWLPAVEAPEETGDAAADGTPPATEATADSLDGAPSELAESSPTHADPVAAELVSSRADGRSA